MSKCYRDENECGYKDECEPGTLYKCYNCDLYMCNEHVNKCYTCDNKFCDNHGEFIDMRVANVPVCEKHNTTIIRH